MPYFNANVGKGEYAELTDRYFGRPPKELRKVYAEALERLAGPADLSLGEVVARDAGKKVATPVSQITADDVQHFQAHWLNRPEVGQIMRQAYKHAIELASAPKTPLPIETLWVTTPGPDFEYYISQTARQITVVACIPAEASEGGRHATETQPMWVVRAQPKDAVEHEIVGTTEEGTPVVLQQLGGKGRAQPTKRA
jgi:hypothetical protein